MKKRMSSKSQTEQPVETTIGELIEAIAEVALKAGRSEEEGYMLASLALERIMRRSIQSPQLPH